MPGLGGILRKSKKEDKEIEVKTDTGKTYLKAVPLRDLADLDAVKTDVKSGNILILRITPLAAKSIDDVRRFYEEQVPLKRGCRISDVMKALLYIIDQEYETGQAVPVTGGQVMLG